MNRALLKKIGLILSVLVMAFAMTACGQKTDGDGMENEEPEEPVAITLEQFQELREMEWPSMTKEEVEEHFGVEGVLNEEATAMWDEGYEVVDYLGPDEDSYVRILYKPDSEGNLKVSSMQGLGALEPPQYNE